jgi:S-adenosyl-L-methionine hydrolase (adenosine-forming)
LSRPEPTGADGGVPATVFFLSDYGLTDEFVGVVHAAVLRHAPGATVVDLTHGVPPFDVRAGSAALARSVPHLGPGVVLAVVDPGVGGDRLGVAVQAEGAGRWFVGPDNGLLVDAVERCGGVRRAVALSKGGDAPATFDGRDVFAPAAAALASGGGPEGLGSPIPPETLVRLAPPVAEVVDLPGSGTGSHGSIRAEVTWVDRFGNVQLAVPASLGPPPAQVDGAGHGSVSVLVRPAAAPAASTGPGVLAEAQTARRVTAFGALGPGELGVLSDANGYLALVLRQGSAAAATGATEGAVVELVW